MESLYRKYRPLTFDSVVGQHHIVSTLEHAITEDACPMRTCSADRAARARPLWRAFLPRHCSAAMPRRRAPMVQAAACPTVLCEVRAIAEGNHPDVYELDAASRTGVDNVREEIINSVNFAPVRGKYKIYIIDEVHMLTTAAFNARCSRRLRSRRHT